jgi:hypothetical protein
MKEWAQSKALDRKSALFRSYVIAYMGCPTLGEYMFWDFVQHDAESVWVSADSSLFGIYTTIDDYENKKGVVSKAHYSMNGKYVGSVKTLGDKPISYKGNFRVNKEKFVLDEQKIKDIYWEARRDMSGEFEKDIKEAKPCAADYEVVHRSDVWKKYSFESVFTPISAPAPDLAPEQESESESEPEVEVAPPTTIKIKRKINFVIKPKADA